MQQVTEPTKKPTVPIPLDRSDLYWLAGMLLLALIPRVIAFGWDVFTIDEVLLVNLSMRLGRYGEWLWISKNASQIPFVPHSPLTIYLTGLPYLLSPSPIGPRLVILILNIAAIPLSYINVRRLYGRTEAVLATVLLAVHTANINAARTVWNPFTGLLFTVAWLYFSLEGAVHQRRWRAALSWPALSLAVQGSISAVLFVPAHLMLAILAFLHHAVERKRLLTENIVGIGLALLVTLPWMIGVYQFNFREGADPNTLVVSGENERPDPLQRLARYYQVMANATGGFGALSTEMADESLTTRPPEWVIKGRSDGLALLSIGAAFYAIVLVARKSWQEEMGTVMRLKFWTDHPT